MLGKKEIYRIGSIVYSNNFKAVDKFLKKTAKEDMMLIVPIIAIYENEHKKKVRLQNAQEVAWKEFQKIVVEKEKENANADTMQ